MSFTSGTEVAQPQKWMCIAVGMSYSRASISALFGCDDMRLSSVQNVCFVIECSHRALKLTGTEQCVPWTMKNVTAIATHENMTDYRNQFNQSVHLLKVSFHGVFSSFFLIENKVIDSFSIRRFNFIQLKRTFLEKKSQLTEISTNFWHHAWLDNRLS